MSSKIRGSDGFDSADALQTTGLATAWVSFDNTGTILESYNVSSVTDNSAGNFTPNFTVTMDTNDYAAQVSGDITGAISIVSPTNLLTSSVTATFAGWSGASSSSATFQDPVYAAVTIHGGKT